MSANRLSVLFVSLSASVCDVDFGEDAVLIKMLVVAQATQEPQRKLIAWLYEGGSDVKPQRVHA